MESLLEEIGSILLHSVVGLGNLLHDSPLPKG